MDNEDQMARIETVTFSRARLREAMTHAGMTPTRLAARTGVSASFVSRALAERPVGKLAAKALCLALRSKLSALTARVAEAIA